VIDAYNNSYLAMTKAAIQYDICYSIPMNGCSCLTIEGDAAAVVAVASVAVAAAAVVQRSSSTAVDVLWTHYYTVDHLCNSIIHARVHIDTQCCSS
jgi:hypothetical protein